MCALTKLAFDFSISNLNLALYITECTYLIVIVAIYLPVVVLVAENLMDVASVLGPKIVAYFSLRHAKACINICCIYYLLTNSFFCLVFDFDFHFIYLI